MTAPKRRWLPVTIAASLTAVALVMVWGAWRAYQTAYGTIPNSYAVEWVANMVTEFMATHNDAWPAGWDDLREPYERLTERAGKSCTFDELRGRVDVDWNADPQILSHSQPIPTGPPFKVIWLRDGSATYWTGAEPNQIVLAYLRSRHDGATVGTAK